VLLAPSQAPLAGATGWGLHLEPAGNGCGLYLEPAGNLTIMKRAIEKVVVLGAGTMGARIAAHVANAGVWCALLDMVPPELNADDKKRGLTVTSPEFRNRIVNAGIAAAA